MKKLIVVFSLLFLFSAPSQAAADSDPDPKIRFAFTPMLGLVGGLPGMAAELGMGYGMAAGGIRYADGKQFCLMCYDEAPASENQIALLAGVREEMTHGSISLKSGVVLVDRDTPDGSPDTGYGSAGVRNYNGFGIPFPLDLMLSGRFIGLSLSATVVADGDGGSAGLMAGIPVGLLLWR